MSDITIEACPARDFQILLDGSPVKLPPGGRTLNGVRCYLESLALEQQRILCSFKVDGAPAEDGSAEPALADFSKVEAITIELEDLPLYLIGLAREQTRRAWNEALSAADLVAVEDCCLAREFWWNLAIQLRQPLLTLNLVPETLCGATNGATSISQLRKWQLQQLGTIIRDVDEACWSEDAQVLLGAINGRVLPWLENLQRSLELLRETIASAPVFARR